MNRFLYPAAFAAGLLAVAWVGAGYADGHWLALSVTLLIGATFCAGAFELRRHRAATAALQAAVSVPPADALAPWLQALPEGLRGPVQRRLDGERAALPAPALTPYLVGLLVLLGMVGTFLGMVVTLKGTVAALESTADLQAMRTALAAPVRGLGLAFGTSVAGVCASAMLGLMSTLARRERLQAAAALEALLAGPLQRFTRSARRDEGWQQLQAQAALIPTLMPALVDRVQALMERLAAQSQATNASLVAGQERFHREAEAAFRGLASSVEQALKSSLAEGGRLAAATLQPAVERTLAGLAEQAGTMHAQSAQALQQHGQAVTAAVNAGLARAEAESAGRSAALADQLAARFAGQADALVQTLATRHGEQQAALAAHEAERLHTWTGTLEAAAERMRQASQVHAEATIAEVSRLMQTAAEAPRVAAEVIGQLREQLSASVAHDNLLLDERRRLLDALATLLQGIEAGTQRQRETVDTLARATANGLAELEARFAARVEAGAAALEAAAAQGTAGAVEVASLAEAFGQAVHRYGDASDRLLAQLQRVEAALDQAATRSDEQLGYVVAQAREVIDLSLLSQKQILDEMQQMAQRHAALVDEAR